MIIQFFMVRKAHFKILFSLYNYYKIIYNGSRCLSLAYISTVTLIKSIIMWKIAFSVKMNVGCKYMSDISNGFTRPILYLHICKNNSVTGQCLHFESMPHIRDCSEIIT